jgi:hypothetical protein
VIPRFGTKLFIINRLQHLNSTLGNLLVLMKYYPGSRCRLAESLPKINVLNARLIVPGVFLSHIGVIAVADL